MDANIAAPENVRKPPLTGVLSRNFGLLFVSIFTLDFHDEGLLRYL